MADRAADTAAPFDPVDDARGSEFAAEIERDSERRAKARSIKPLARLAPFILRYPFLLAAFILSLIVASGLTLVLPAAFRIVVDCGFSGASASAVCRHFAVGENLSGYFLIGIGVGIALGIASASRFYFVSRLGERVVTDLRRAVYDHIIGLSPSFYAQVRTGEVLSRLTTDTTLIETLVGSSISVALRTLATTAGAIVLMFTVNWRLTLMVAGIGPLILIPIILFGRRVRSLSRSSQDSLAFASARAGETLTAIETVQAFTRETEEREAFARAAEATFDVSLQRIAVRAMMTAIFFSVILAGVIGVLWYGATQVQSGGITPGAMTQLVMYAFIAVSGAGMLTETYAEVMRAAGATERLMELLAAKSEIDAPANPTRLPATVRGEVAFDAVRFAYPLRPESQALNGVTLQVDPGETVALVGPSGAGKSTMFQLLLRFYDPQSGAVRLDGVDIKSLDPRELRRSISVVQQNAPLFSGDAAENIRFGRPEASDEEVRAAAMAANAHDFIMALPQGYETPLGQGATTLSGGQRQRLAIARAILRNAPVLLLDEATSSLDSESERAIQQAFEKISADRTTLVIAHRLATVLKADKIVVMDEGVIVDQGTHAELMAR
ncbi:MAG TPA: ABC transporter transmembrane domain-containing protein, partial [Parvularculaceae bacterium]|nr:ABC transporter transmembrane domain-containing protein [Parvularculaceae bacterium]